MDIYRFSDYREILREELLRRSQQNPRYSQGAFARDIFLTPSRLSEVLNGKQGISVKVAHDIARSLRFDDKQTAFFGDLVESQHGRSRLARESASARLERYRHSSTQALPTEHLERLLSKWYYLATLELTKIQGFMLSVETLAETLRLEGHEANDAIDTLTQLELLREVEGRFVATPVPNGAHGRLNQTSVSKFHAQMIDLSLRRRYSAEAQKVLNYLMAVDAEKLPELVNHLVESVEYVVGRADDAKNKSSLYGLTVALFPIHDDSLSIS